MVVIDAWSRYFVELLKSSCLLTHNIVPHISWHNPPYHKTMKKYEDSEGMIVFLFLPLKFAIRTRFCNCPQYLCLFHIVFGCSPRKHDRGKMLVLPNQLLCSVVSTFTNKNIFSRCTNKHSQLETFSQPYFKRIFANCLSHNSPAKDDRTDFAQEERLGLLFWTVI